MGVKKDIGKTYKDKLNDINISPDDRVWEKIQKSLDSKKRNKIIPFWARTIGIGILLLLISVLGYNYFFNYLDYNELKQKNNKEIKQLLDDEKSITDINNSSNNGGNNIDIESNSSDANNNTSSDVNENGLSGIDSGNNQETLSNNDSEKNVNTSNQKSNKYSNNNKTLKNRLIDKNSKYSNQGNSNANKIVNLNNNTSQQLSDSNIGNSSNNNNTINSNSISSENKIDENNKKITENINVDSNNIELTDTKNKLLNTINSAKKDSVKIEPKFKKDTLLIASKNDSIVKKKPEEPKSEWEVGIYIIPTYFGSLTKGSSLGEILTENKKQANITLSYRVLANFKLSNKLTLRTGFGSTKLSTTTLSATRTDANGMMTNLGAFSNLSYDFIKLNEVETSNSLGSNTDVNFKEEYTYFELPIEVVYKFEPKNNITWKVFSGISTYKISNNRVYAESPNGSFEIGQANNLKQYSFSFNFGGGLDYKINDKINVTAEPIVRYHISMYKRKVFNYNPINTGVSIGISYKF